MASAILLRTMTYLALLRGINVGGNSTVPMETLKECLMKLGFLNVRTYINSGNVLFETAPTDAGELQNIIELALLKRFDFPITVIIKNEKELRRIAKAVPSHWQNNATQKTDILFLRDTYDNPKTRTLIAHTKDVDAIIYTKGALIWNVSKDQYSKSGMRKFIGTTVYKNMTARNVNTVRKLASLV